MRPRFQHLLLLFQLTALDAPLVALVWQEMAAKFCGGAPSVEERWILFFTVWGIYLADRVFDVARLTEADLPALRHRFARRHWRVFFAGAVLNFLAAFSLAVTCLTGELLVLGGVLVMLCGGYLLWRHALPGWKIGRPLRAGCVGAIFAAGVVLAGWLRSPHAAVGLLYWVPLTLLFSANVLEAEVVESRFQGDANGHNGFAMAIAAAMIAIVLLLFARDSMPVHALIFAGLGTAMLSRCQARFTPDGAAALGDAILIAPAVCLLLGHS